MYSLVEQTAVIAYPSPSVMMFKSDKARELRKGKMVKAGKNEQQQKRKKEKQKRKRKRGKKRKVRETLQDVATQYLPGRPIF